MVRSPCSQLNPRQLRCQSTGVNSIKLLHPDNSIIASAVSAGLLQHRPIVKRAADHGRSSFRAASMHLEATSTAQDGSHSSSSQDSQASDSTGTSYSRTRRRKGLKGTSNTPNSAESGGLPSNGTPGPQQSRQMRNPANGKSAARPSWDLQEKTLPPHLAAARNPQLANSRQPGAAAEGPLRALPQRPQIGALPQQRPASADRLSVLDSQNGAAAPISNEITSVAAAEVNATSEKAEGILQLGASGPRIPLYGRCISPQPCTNPLKSMTLGRAAFRKTPYIFVKVKGD